EYPQELLYFLPAIIVAIGGIVVMMADAFSKKAETTYWLSVGFLLVALLVSINDLFRPAGDAFYGFIAHGGMASFGVMLVMLGTFFCVLLCREYLVGIKHHMGEVYSMIMFATVGMVVLASSNNLVTVFLGIETMSISLYVLAGLVKNEKAGIEAALKYFLLGAFSTGFFLYGIALLYGAAGSTSLQAIGQVSDPGLIYWGGVALLLVGFLFKISAVPFHMWTPDVYQGAPTTITAYMSTASKTAAVVSLILVLDRAFPHIHSEWSQVFAVIAVLTMILGNLVAIVQDSVKRMLAYSSIAHVGYILIGLAAGTADAYNGVLYYLLAYTIMNVGAFGVVAYYERQKGLDFTNVTNYAGLGYKQPMLGVLLSIFLFSLAGIPPFAGFIGKYLVFAAAVNEGMIGLVVLGVLASAASVYYYLRVMVYLYMKEETEATSIDQPGAVYKYSLLILAILTVYFGIQPGGITQLLLGY
ncbi:MAG: NADH-quinone oxidoreductase subunit N, partial [Balneolales bacterium]